MVSQYPHIIEKFITTADQQNSNGDWIPGSEEFSEIGMCRDAPNGAGKVLTLTDGKAIVYNSIIYLPLAEYDIRLNDKVRVKDGNEVRIQSNVLRISKGQLNVRIWL